eukprot:g38351.t1
MEFNLDKCESFEYRSWDVMLRLYKTLVRLLLEYYVQFWLPSYRKHIIKLERVQKRFTKMLPGMECLSYEERLDRQRQLEAPRAAELQAEEGSFRVFLKSDVVQSLGNGVSPRIQLLLA